MNKRSIGAIAGLASLLAGCATSNTGTATYDSNYKRPAVAGIVPRHERGHELRNVTGNDVRYSLEEMSVAGERLYVEKNIGDRANGKELPVVFVRYDDVSRHIMPNGIVDLVADDVYIPTKVENDKGYPKTTVTFSTEGPYATRANLTQFNAPRNKPIGVIRTSNSDLNMNIRTITLGGVEYFVPFVEKDQVNNEALGFYLVPVKSAEQIIEQKTGRISIKSEEGIFRPVKVSRGAYQEKILAKEGLVEPQANPAQAEKTE